jgi:hypothetical protein
MPLLRALGAVFVAALRFYRLNRGSGPTAIDVSTYFKRRYPDKEFAPFWRSSRNTGRRGVQSAWTRFQKALNEELSR